MKNILVGDVMKTEIIVAGKQHKFSQVMEFFNLYNIRHLLVTEDKVLLGIISCRDVLRILSEKLLSGEDVSIQHLDETYTAVSLMTTNPVTLAPDASLEDAISLLSEGSFHALPVVEDGIVKGIVTEHDLVMAYNKEKHPAHFEIDTPGFGI